MSEELPSELAVFGNPLGDSDKLRSGRITVDRYGVTNAVILRRRYEPSVPSSFDWLDIKSAPNCASLPCIGIERSHTNGLAEYQYSYEGAIESLKGADNFTFELDITMNQEPIQTHPDFQNLKNTYGWNSLTKEFMELLPKNSTATGLDGNKAGSSQAARSPLYGVEHYFTPGGIFRKTSISSQLPPGIYNNIGTPQTPPGIGLFSLPGLGNRNWLKLAPKVRRRGNVVEVVEEYMLSGPRGWEQAIYNSSALKSSSAGSGGFGSPGLS
jgi:hypothetical protein